MKFTTKFTTKFTLLIISVIFFNCSSVKDRALKINGTVVNTDTKSILLMKPNQDISFDSLIEIPVENGKFYYTYGKFSSLEEAVKAQKAIELKGIDDSVIQKVSK